MALFHEFKDRIAKHLRSEQVFFVQDHRDIYSYIEKNVLKSKVKPSVIDYFPTLDIIVYAIKNILYPTFDTYRIPELLDLLAMVEFYRGRILEISQTAREWDIFYQQQGADVISLTQEDQEFIAKQESRNESFRRVYITIVKYCCDLDMYHLWTAETVFMADFWARFRQYFPFLDPHSDGAPDHLVHDDLADAEIEELADTGIRICTFLMQTLEWVEAGPKTSESISGTFQTDSFREAFPPICSHERLSELIEQYIAWVMDAADQLNYMFTVDNV